MDVKSFEQKTLKINTLVGIAKEVNSLYFEKKEEKVELIEDVVSRIKKELEDY